MSSSIFSEQTYRLCTQMIQVFLHCCRYGTNNVIVCEIISNFVDLSGRINNQIVL